MEKIYKKIEYLQKDYDKIVEKLLSTGSCSDIEKLKKECGQKISALHKLIDNYLNFQKINNRIKTLEHKLKYDADPHMENTLINEIERKNNIEQKIKDILTPKNFIDFKDIRVQVMNRSKTHGVDWAQRLSDAYIKYFLKMGWKYTKADKNDHVFDIHGNGTFKIMAYEKGLHKIKADKSYILSVEVSPKVNKRKYTINNNDLRIEVFHSSGHGGQSVNTSNSAVRIVHIPTGITAESQDQRSQYQNKKNAIKVLKNRVIEYFDSFEYDKIDFKNNEHAHIIRFYDFNHNLISDHRLKKSYDKLNAFFKGDLFFLIEELKEHEYVKELEKFINL